MSSKPITFLRRPQVEARRGESRSTLYQHIANGTLTKPVPLGPRSVAWPEHEIDALNRARLAGATPDEIRALVERLHQARTDSAA